MSPEIHYAEISEISRRIREQKVSPVEVVKASLERIEKLNPTLNAFITVLADEGLKQATAAEAEVKSGDWRGPLHGIPVGIKDFYDTAGIRTTAAFERFKDRLPARDAASVAKLKRAGAIVIGKTNMHELGMGTTALVSYYGPVRNPWDAEHIAGGSSGGSAAAVASGMCYATLDTDAIGSCRLPAACCGVVGFKGTYGLISPQGILEGEKADEMILWLAHPAITTRSVQDTAHVLDVIAERNSQTIDANFARGLARGGKPRIGVASNFTAAHEVAAAFESAVDTVRDFGYPLGSVVVPLWDAGRGIANIEADRKAIAQHAFKDVDVLLLPTTTTTVPRIKDAGANPLALSPENTSFANYYGLPAISAPCGFDSNGLPLGVQVVGKPWGEQTVFRLTRQYLEATGWGKKHPIP